MKILNKTIAALCLLIINQACIGMTDQYLFMSKPIGEDVTTLPLLLGYHIAEPKEEQTINKALGDLINADEELQQTFSVSSPSPESIVWLLIDPSGSVCGYIRHGLFDSKSAIVELLIIHPQHRGKGLAGILLSLVENYWSKQTIDKLVLIVKRDNTSALKAYEKHGFTAETT